MEAHSRMGDVDDGEQPQEGSFCICLNCGALNKFTKDLHLQQTTEEDLREIKMYDSETYMKIFVAQSFIKQRGAIREVRN
jgi:hypothetical protein